MEIEIRKCIIPFSDGSETYAIGDKVTVVPSMEQQTCYAVATDYRRVYYIGKEHLSETIILNNELEKHEKDSI